jgi:hypothetical protein
MAGWRLSVQYSTMTLMAVSSKQTNASWATTNWLSVFRLALEILDTRNGTYIPSEGHGE